MKNWQVQVGFWGMLLWLGSFQLGEYFLKNDQSHFASAITGYITGFITVFAGHLFWSRIMKRRWDELLGEGVFRYLSALLLFLIFAYGCFGFYNINFNTNTWYYCLTFAFGGFVINQGLMPIIDTFDRDR